MRLNPEALSIIKKYQDQLAEQYPGYKRIYPSDAVIEMDRQIREKPCVPPTAGHDEIDREVLFKGDKAYINMPRTWANKKVKVIDLTE